MLKVHFLKTGKNAIFILNFGASFKILCENVPCHKDVKLNCVFMKIIYMIKMYSHYTRVWSSCYAENSCTPPCAVKQVWLWWIYCKLGYRCTPSIKVCFHVVSHQLLSTTCYCYLLVDASKQTILCSTNNRSLNNDLFVSLLICHTWINSSFSYRWNLMKPILNLNIFEGTKKFTLQINKCIICCYYFMCGGNLEL